MIILTKFLIAACLCEAYFLFNYYVSNSMISNMGVLIKEINTTSIAEGFYAFTYNAERQLIIDSNFHILGQANSGIDVV